MTIPEIILDITKSFHVKLIDNNSISVIASYMSQLEIIAKHYKIELLRTHSNEFTITGIFKLS